MKKMTAFLLTTLLLFGCAIEEKSFNTEWSEYSDSSIDRLNDLSIEYEIRDDRIFIQEKDLERAQLFAS